MTTTELYRHYDQHGDLLYVGMSISSVVRLGQHRRESEWFGRISTITIERFPSRDLCAKAESQAIKREKPQFNIVNHPQPVRKRESDMMGAGDLARALGVDRKTLRKWVKKGVCPVKPVAEIDPPVWRKADVEAFAGRAL